MNLRNSKRGEEDQPPGEEERQAGNMEAMMSMMTAMMQQMQKTTELQIQAAERRETLDREERAREAESCRTEQEKFQEFMEATLNGTKRSRPEFDGFSTRGNREGT